MSITAQLAFENAFPPQPFEIQGEATLIDSGGSPTSIIQTDDEWSIRFTWNQRGPLSQFMSASNEWHLQILLEEMGKGELDLNGTGTVTVPFVRREPHTYQTNITMPAGSVSPGVYRVVVCMTFTAQGGSPAAEIAAFAEFGLVKFYEAA